MKKYEIKLLDLVSEPHPVDVLTPLLNEGWSVVSAEFGRYGDWLIGVLLQREQPPEPAPEEPLSPDVACDKSPTGKHCWHGTMASLTVHPPIHPQVCCYCGKAMQYQSPGINRSKHGPYLPPHAF